MTIPHSIFKFFNPLLSLTFALTFSLTFSLTFIFAGCTPHSSSSNSSSSLTLPTFPTLSPIFIVDLVFLGVWENPHQKEVWFVGGHPTQRAIARYTAEDHTIRIHLQEEGAPLWWIWGQGDRVWAGGEKGTLLTLNRLTDQWETEVIQLEEEALDKLIIWGIWGNETDQWAVGGSVRRGGPKGVLLHREPSQEDATTFIWKRIESDVLPMEDKDDPLVGLNLYKIWGDSQGSIWCIGEGGYSAFSSDTSNEAWQTLPLITPPTLLFTLHGLGKTDLWTVGGYQNGQL